MMLGASFCCPRTGACTLRALALGAALLAALPLASQTDGAPPVGVPMTLAQLSDFALRNNAATRAAWSAAMADGAAADAARAALAPTVALLVPASASHGAPNPNAPEPPGASPAGTTGAITPTLSLAWVLFDFGARAAGVDAARWQALATRLLYDRTLQSVVNQVEQAYFGLLGARQLESALRTGVASAQASLDAAQTRRRGGLATLGDTAQAQAALAAARLQWLRAQSQARSAEGALAVAIGAPVTTPIALVDDAAAPPDAGAVSAPDPGTLQPVEALIAHARLSRADLSALDAQWQQARSQLRAVEAAARPSIALAAQATRSWVSDGSGRPSQQIGLTLQVPLFDGGLLKAQAAQARWRVDTLAAQRAQQVSAAELEVWQSYQDAQRSDDVVASAQAALASAAVAEDAARERYAAGVGTLLELLSTQAASAQGRLDLVQARYDGRLALSRLAYAVGVGAASGEVLGRGLPGARP